MTTIKFRRDTSANWTSVNPIPAQGEPCYETDTGKLKIGNGSDNYVTLPYVSDGGGSSGDLPIATATTLGGIKVGNNLSITEDGTLSANGGSAGTTDYTQLENKPQINSVELTGNKTLDDLGIQAKGDYQPAGDYATTADIPTKTSQLTNDSGFITSIPVASSTVSGTVKIGSGLSINNGVLSADAQKIDVDSALSSTSVNPVQNKVINSALAGKQDTIEDLATIRTNAQAGKDASTTIAGYGDIVTHDASEFQASGSYAAKNHTHTKADITDFPTIPTKTSELTNDSGFLTEAPTNMVTTDTDQTISGSKAFSARTNFNNGCNFNSSSYSANYFKKGLKIGNVDIYNTTGNVIRMGGNSTHFLTFNDDNIKFMSSSSTPGMSITDGVVTTAYNKPYLKIKEYNDNTDAHNLEIRCDTTNNNSWNIACGGQTFINTANIDTTYMKWDGTNKKLKVDTAAVAGLAMPSDKYIDLTLGASGTKYTAPVNGWVRFVYKTTSQGGWGNLVNSTTDLWIGLPGSSYTDGRHSMFIPVKKGDVYIIQYSGSTGESLRFIYAEGEV